MRKELPLDPAKWKDYAAWLGANVPARNLVERLHRLAPEVWTWTLTEQERRQALALQRMGTVEVEWQHERTYVRLKVEEEVIP